MKRTLAVPLILGGMLFPHGLSHAYEVASHFKFSVQAVERSILSTDLTFLKNLGLRDLSQQFPSTPGTNSKEFTDGCKRGEKFNITRLVSCCAQFEDVPGMRALNHFYDPTKNDGDPLSALSVRVPPPTGAWQTIGMTSPDWALQDNNDNTAQEFSYKDARNYFHQALTTIGVQAERDALWGKLFQSIGQVIHHVQDMAQPQHVRNDQHVDKWWLVPYFNPSLYESYTRDPKNEPRVQATFSLPTSEPVYPGSQSGAFKTPRDFWKNAQGTGLAEFTNRNFVSAGTNFILNDG